MPQVNGSPKPSNTVNFTSPLPLGEGTTVAGISSVGGYDSVPTPTNLWFNYANGIYEVLPAPIRPALPLTGGVTQNSPNSYSVTLSLANNPTLQLNPTFVNAFSQSVIAVAPNVFNGFVYTSRQRLVCMVSNSGLQQSGRASVK